MTVTSEDVEVVCVAVASGIYIACEEALPAAGMAVGDVQDVELRRPVETVLG